MKKGNFLRLIAFSCVALMMVMLFAACGRASSSTKSMTNAEATAVPQTSASAKASTASDGKVYTFKMHHHQNPGSAGDAVAQTWVNLVEEYANGKVDITVYGAQTLGKATDAWDMVVNDVADISWGFVPNFAGQFPITEGVSLPMMNIGSAVQGSEVLQAMYESNTDMQNEYADVHVLFFHTHDPGYLGLKKAASTMEDLSGRRIRVQGDGQTSMIQALGASAVPVTLPDLYESLEKGVVDGYALGMEGIGSFKLKEVTSYLLDCRYYVGAFWMVMNKDVWDSLPADVQEAFNKASGMAGAVQFGSAWDDAAAKALQDCKDYGVQVTELGADETQRWSALADGIQEKWAQSLTDSGLDGNAILSQYKALIEQYA